MFERWMRQLFLAMVALFRHIQYHRLLVMYHRLLVVYHRLSVVYHRLLVVRGLVELQLDVDS